MGIQEKIIAELKTAMKAKDSVRVNTLRMVRAQLKDFEIAKGDPLTDDDVLSVLSNAAKKRKEAMALYEKGNRPDLLEQEKRELEIISSFLPRQLGREEIEQHVARTISEIGAVSVRDMGKVMSAVMQQLKGKADGKLVQEIVKAKLQ